MNRLFLGLLSLEFLSASQQGLQREAKATSLIRSEIVEKAMVKTARGDYCCLHVLS